MAKHKKVTVTQPQPAVEIPSTKHRRIRLNWRRKDGKEGNSPLFRFWQKDKVEADCLKWLAVAIDPELKAVTGEEKWVIVHMPSRGRVHWDKIALRFEVKEKALALAAELEHMFGKMWEFSSPGLMDEFLEERARRVIGRRIGR
jgi:hypothetical protein